MQGMLQGLNDYKEIGTLPYKKGISVVGGVEDTASWNTYKEKVIVEADFLWHRMVDSLKTSFHLLLWTSSGLKE